MKPVAFALAALALIFSLPADARAEKASPLAMDLSAHDVAITTSFVGSDLLLFGTTGGKGDVIVVVRGPSREEIVRRKERVSGIWVNKANVTFDGTPSFYKVISSRPLNDILSGKERAAHQIGFDGLKLKLVHTDGVDASAEAEFREALIRQKQAKGLYIVRDDGVKFIKSGLFRLNISLPSNITTGSYHVDTFLVRSGRVVSTQTATLPVHKVGFEAKVYDFAHNYGLAYGVLAVIIAVAAGWVASIAFRKG